MEDNVTKTTMMSRAVELDPPKAKIIPHRMEKHGHVRVDDYYWLRERESPAVIDHLKAENAYTEAVMKHTEKLQEELFEEIKGRIKQDDSSVPFRQDDYYYYVRQEEDRQYPIHCRKKGSLEASEEIMLDVNEMAEGLDYFSVDVLTVSHGQDILAYAVDNVGRRVYTIHFKNLETGEIFEESLPNAEANMAWATDNKTLFYARQDPDTLRSYRIYRHELGSDPALDELVYEEEDETFRTYVMRTKSKKYLLIGSFQSVSSEYRFLESANPKGEFRLIEPRRREHEYDLDHFGDHFYIQTNDGAKNFRLMKAPTAAPGRENWQEILPHRDDVLLESFEIFKDHLVIAERRDGLMRMRILPWAGGEEHEIDFGEPAYTASFSANRQFDTPLVRFHYSSLTTPGSTYDYDMVKREKKLLKRDEILGDFDPADYRTERLHARAPDGAEVPISLVYRRDRFTRDGQNPLLLYGYGAYGLSRDASFSASRLSLLDRGFVYALAHIRGGEELGRQWYEDGKLLAKKNTFSDFIACGEHLVAEKYADPRRLYAYGGSAGGLLVGAVLNERPDLWSGAISAVPFVDVVTTMLDDSIPLTTNEYDEWGNPNEEEFYRYILSYSPYDNIRAQDYPPILVSTGLHDSQVQYWEPAKWVAKLRAMKTDSNPLLLKTRLEAGHGGPSGRYEQYRETAFYWAFLLDLAEVSDGEKQ